MEAEIKYTEKLKGDDGNYDWPARFDLDRGYLGVTQWVDNGKIECVLLSPAQVDALLAFLQANKASSRTAGTVHQKSKSKSKKASAKPSGSPTRRLREPLAPS